MQMSYRMTVTKKTKISEEGFSILRACFGELELDVINNNLKKGEQSSLF